MCGLKYRAIRWNLSYVNRYWKPVRSKSLELVCVLHIPATHTLVPPHRETVTVCEKYQEQQHFVSLFSWWTCLEKKVLRDLNQRWREDERIKSHVFQNTHIHVGKALQTKHQYLHHCCTYCPFYEQGFLKSNFLIFTCSHHALRTEDRRYNNAIE